MPQSNQKTYIGVLASRDSDTPNKNLISIFNRLFADDKQARDNFSGKFHFVITGGTYGRIFAGYDKVNLNSDVENWLRGCSTWLPRTEEGGVIILSKLICQRKIDLVWMLFEPNTIHWQRQENMALMRLCDQWHAKKLMNFNSIEMWFNNEKDFDTQRNLQELPLTLKLRSDRNIIFGNAHESPSRNKLKEFEGMTIALIAHDAMKEKMIDFAVDHENELNKFKKIITTQTTGKKIEEVTDHFKEKITKCLTGPKGGDIEIATEIIYNECHVVIFFIDPLHPHPHIEDIRVISQACMINDQAIVITNESHARDFMRRVVRGRDRFS